MSKRSVRWGLIVLVFGLTSFHCTALLGVDQDYYLASGGSGGSAASSGSSSGTGGCTSWQTLCEGRCVDTQRDAANCGDCGKACPASNVCQGGSCMCEASLSACSGTCVVTSIDKANCGSCGHDCQGGACQDAQCQPVLLASGQTSPAGITVDAMSVYWTTSNGGTVMKKALSGGNPVTLAAGQASPWADLVVDATYVYWANGGVQGKKSVMKVQADNTWVPIVLAASTPQFPVYSPYGVAVDATQVYWTDFDGGTVMKVPIAGGTPVLLASGQDNPRGIAVAATSIYWANHKQPMGTVMKMPIGGGVPVPLASGLNAPLAIALDATSVYFTTLHEVMRVPIGGGMLVTLASGQDIPWSIAIDATSVYWVNWGSLLQNGTVMTVPLGGGTPVTLASGQAKPQGVAVDARAVYWTNSGDGTIMKLAK